MMKRILPVLLLIPSLSFGQTLLNENFSTYTSNADLNGQNGWSNNSSNPGGGGACVGVLCTNLRIVDRSMTFPGFGSSTKAVTIAPDRDAPGKPFTATSTGSVYLSVLVNLSTAPASSVDLIRVLAGGNFNTADRIVVRGVSGGFNAGITKGSGSAVYKSTSPTTVSYGADHLLVLKYTYNTGSTSDDEVTLYIDPNLSIPEASNTPEVTTTTGSDVTAAIDRVQLPYNSSSRATGFIGGITVSTAFGPSMVLPASNVTNVSVNRLSADKAGVNYTVTRGERIQKINIQHSLDGVNFVTVNMQDNITNRPYSHEVSLNTGINFIRLEVVDKDQQVSYTRVITLKGDFKKTASVSITPIPARDVANLTVTSSHSEKATITILDMAGKIVYTKAHQLQVGQNVLPLEISNLVAGQYLTRVVTASQEFSPAKFLKR